jgi:arylsulfatase A-like enzyme
VGERREPSSLVDIAPTLVGYLGLPTEGFDGRCLTP